MSKDKIKKELPDNLKINWLFILVPFAVAIVVGIIIGSIKHFGTERTITYAYGRIELNWDGASEGKAPNGEGYDLLRVDNSEIIAEAITKLGLSVTVEEVQNNLVISGQYPDDIINNMTSTNDLTEVNSVEDLEVTQFHPSTYTVSLKNGFSEKISKKVLSSLLTEILNGYYTEFFEQYTIGYDTSVVLDVLDTSQYDYNQILSVLEYRLELVEKNANSLAKLDSAYRYNSKSFADMAVVAQKLIDTELNKAQASCVVNGLSKDYNSMLQSTYYNIRSLQLSLDEAQSNVDNIAALITEYERDQSAFVTTATGVELEEGNSSATYEALMKQQTEYAEKVSELSSKISYYEDVIENIKNSVYTSEYDAYCADLETSISELITKVTETEASMSEMINSYNDTEIGSDAIVISKVSVDYARVFSLSYIVSMVKACGPLCMLVLIYALCMELRRRILIDRLKESEEM